MNKLLILILGVSISHLKGDIYLHNPRGSNNRLDENTNERRSPNRLFDSENNNRGGYNVGFMYYYVDSKLNIEWTNQHGCKNSNTNCDIIIQYMCSDNLRDGTTTQQIPTNVANCQNNDCNSDLKYGMHEDYNYYRTCLKRARNKGLFVAGKSLPNSAMYTRQNQNGQVSGYECSEERDYYPYWHPTPWRDIAVLTDKIEKCEYYKKESENVKSRWHCKVSQSFIDGSGIIPNNKEECENQAKGVWIENPSHGIDPPNCHLNFHTRDNHLGDTIGGISASFNWTIPNNPNLNCALRIRYNITTNDYDSENTFSNSKIQIYPELNDALNRGFKFQDNPEVKLFSNIDFKLKLAVNTAQYGRVFQDRSHRFEIRKRPDNLSGVKLVNVNVRGKRGNIVQVYPGVEYDFVPNRVEVSLNDYIHFQWTGSNSNPLGNDGQGAPGTDRSNIIALVDRSYHKGSLNAFDPLNEYGSLGVNYPKNLSHTSFLGLSQDSLANLALFNPNLFGSMEQLNDATPYFDLMPQKVTQSGVFYYMSTRNNNFSNRDQKGILITNDFQFNGHLFDQNGGILTFSDGQIIIEKHSFNDLTYIRADVMNKDLIKKYNRQLDTSKFQDLASNFVVISPNDKLTSIPFELKINLNEDTSKFLNSINSINVYRIAKDSSVMTKIDAKFDGSHARISNTHGGIYVATKERNYGIVIGIVVSIGVVIILSAVLVIFLKRNPKYMHSLRYRVNEAKRTLLPRV